MLVKYTVLVQKHTMTWTTDNLLDFLAIAALASNFINAVLLIGMIRMPGGHCAENIKQVF